MKSSPGRTPAHQGPCCQALYDFDPENPGELGLKVCKIQENYTLFAMLGFVGDDIYSNIFTTGGRNNNAGKSY